MKKTLTSILLAASLLGGCKDAYKEYLIEKSANPRMLTDGYCTDIIKEKDQDIFEVSHFPEYWKSGQKISMVIAIDRDVNGMRDGKFDEIKTYDKGDTTIDIKKIANQKMLDSLRNEYNKRLNETDLSDF